MRPSLLLALALLLPAIPAAAERSVEDYHREAAELLSSRKDPEGVRRARVVLRYGLRRYPDAEPLHRLEGIAAFRLDERDAARRAFRRAIELRPGVSFNYLKLASLELCAEKDRAASRSVLRTLFERRPEDHAAREQAALLCERCGDPDGAAGHWLQLVRRRPGEAWLYRFRVAQLYHRAGRYRSAHGLLARVLEEGPEDHAELPAQMGATLARLGDAEGARRWYREALKRAPEPALTRSVRKALAGLD